MKILERKEPFDPWPRRYNCAGCRSVLEVDAVDIHQPTQRDVDGKGWFRCPVCDALNYLSPKETIEASRAYRMAHRNDPTQ